MLEGRRGWAYYVLDPAAIVAVPRSTSLQVSVMEPSLLNVAQLLLLMVRLAEKC